MCGVITTTTTLSSFMWGLDEEPASLPLPHMCGGGEEALPCGMMGKQPPNKELGGCVQGMDGSAMLTLVLPSSSALFF
jgi:hypothetical protein